MSATGLYRMNQILVGLFVQHHSGARKVVVDIDATDDPSLVREMALSGCNGVFVGLESLVAENLTDARKKTPLPGDYARRVDIFHSFGIRVNPSFVFGFDHDTPDLMMYFVNEMYDN